MVSIFIRTFEGDLDWLRYCLASIHRNLAGWGEIVICIPEGQVDKLKGLITNEIVVTCPAYSDDYIGQQISKLQAYRHVKGEFVLYVASDVVFSPGANVSAYFQDGKPVILKESYARLDSRHPHLDTRKWQDVVNLIFGAKPSHEYMRRAPQIFRTETLAALDRAFPQLEDHALRQPNRRFSEFNVLGYFVERYEPFNYIIIDLEHEPLPPNPAMQYWSWGGVSPDIFAQLVELGVADPACPPDCTHLPHRPRPPGLWKRFRYVIKGFFRGLKHTR